MGALQPSFLRNCKTQNVADFFVNINRFIKFQKIDISLPRGRVSCYTKFGPDRYGHFMPILET